MPIYAVIDTNVLVSALLARHTDASPVRIVELVFSGRLIPLYSPGIIAEYSEVLKRPKFHFTPETVETMLKAILLVGENAEPLSTGVTLPDSKDLVFYEVTMARQEDDAHLVTGNKKHFPAEPRIVTPNEMLEIMDRKRD